MTNPTHTNALISETSPYLLQHAHNPVDWKAWNAETLQKAKEEQKLMIVSIGYAACHWCHVMEHESFEDEEVALVMNTDYISVKVDREERPDIDQIYINAVQLMTGHAGWPLNVVTLPDGRPIWGGTYFKKEQWIDALEQLQKAYKEQPEKLEEHATKLEAGIKNMDLIALNTETVSFKKIPTNEIVSNWSKNFDPRFGGFKRAPKFMMPNNWHFLLRYAVQNNDEEVKKQVLVTLDQMAYGGIYDQIEGGFSRYSVDEKWHIPHFEKMLYDNAQLVSLYSDAYLVTHKNLYKEIIEETLSYIATEMTTNEGTFYSSLDADSKNLEGTLEEGAYYVFTKLELQELLGDDFPLFAEYYNVNSFGKWEHNNYVLIRDKTDAEIIKEYAITSEGFQKKKKSWKSILTAHRKQRAKPRLDDKTLTSWNALMLKGYVDAYKALQKPEYLTSAIKNARFISEKLTNTNGRIFHNYKNGTASINGFLEDYATVIEAYIALYEVTLDATWLSKSKSLTEYTFQHFYDEEKGMFYFTSNEDAALVTRTFEYRDNVIPASNSIMAKNLFKLSRYFENEMYAETAKQQLKNILPELEKYPSGFSNWMDLLANYQHDFYEVVVVGENASEKIKELNQHYIPNKIIAGSTTETDEPLLKSRYVDDTTFIYVCVNNTCNLPVTETKIALETLKNTD
ncbi:thioredoxin [Cochleicola gelatinilyticus]|uniref:Thioredoxin n=1 Tax=Cochleicola gelatinilyticus TaxID=1763537 RepID=A0A167JGX4_9FLAO|nr:thioredoxin [Cochleicola gelatinilyticus]